MNQRTIARTLRDVAKLYEIEGANPFKAKALREAAEHIAASEWPLEVIVEKGQLLPGVGNSTAHLIRSIATRGPKEALAELDVSVPASLLELLAVPGVGPKSVKQMYDVLHITTLSELETAIEDGTLGRLSGFGPKRLEKLRRDLALLHERLRVTPIAVLWPFAVELIGIIRGVPGVERVSVTGQARRLITECRELEIVVGLTEFHGIDDWIHSLDTRGIPIQQQHMGEGSQYRKVVELALDFEVRTLPVRMHLVDDANFPVVLMRTTGDDVHVEVVERLMKERQVSWVSFGTVQDEVDGTLMTCATEEDLYAAIGLPYYPPELREGRGILVNPKELLELRDIQGDLHVHSRWSDGTESIECMALFAKQLGYQYIAITDHSKSLTIAGGLSEDDLHRQIEEIRRLNQTMSNFTIFTGIEVDILSDGRLDLSDDLLYELDVVVASIHSGMQNSKQTLTKRILSAIEHPAVDIIGHPNGRIIGRREPYSLDMDAIIRAASKRSVALELNANPNRLDLWDDLLRSAVERGVTIAINTDAHSTAEFDYMQYGVRMSYRGWVKKASVLNALSPSKLRQKLHNKRHSANF